MPVIDPQDLLRERDELRAEVERLRVREIHLCSELARLALDYVTTQDEAHAELDEQQLASEMIAFADSWSLPECY
jgi:hypothetical protein